MCAIILVVFIHSHNGEVKFASGDSTGSQSWGVLFIENFLSKGIAKIAAPLFFAISGFLLYFSYKFTVRGVVDKFKKRLRGLVIPYLFWSAYGLVLVWILQSLPWSKVFFTRELVADFSISKLLFTIFLDPVPYQLWFVRDLIMLVIFSPLIWYLTKSIRWVWLVILLFLWFADRKTFVFFSNEALLFFTLGCFLATDKNNTISKKNTAFSSYCALILWLLLVLVTTCLVTFSHTFSSISFDVINNLGILAGIISVWSLYDQFHYGPIEEYSFLFNSSFFIFVFHEPLLTILKKGMFFYMGKTNFSSLIIYVAAPVITIGLSVIVRLAFKKGAPGLYNFATGGR